MNARLLQPLPVDGNAVVELVCPACYGDLSPADGRLVCNGCGRRYPVVDGIPVLIVERGEMPGNGR